ncbi:hypothetical protein ABNX41_17470 [Rhodobacteraceae bacterium PA1-206B]
MDGLEAHEQRVIQETPKTAIQGLLKTVGEAAIRRLRDGRNRMRNKGFRRFGGGVQRAG